jgi:uncharacterized Rmd1/YagE family protein
MDCDEQYDFLNDRVDHAFTEIDSVAARVTALESDEEVKKSRTLEWIVIVLILVEIIESLAFWHYHG